jgi:hypothetical protein
LRRTSSQVPNPELSAGIDDNAKISPAHAITGSQRLKNRLEVTGSP